MKRLKILILLLLVFEMTAIFAQRSGDYKSLLSDTDNSAYAHLIIQVPENQQKPKEWNVEWFVSLYVQNGYRLFLGMINDNNSLRKKSKLVFKIPIGNYKIVITKKTADWSMENIFQGKYDLGSGQWIPPNLGFEIVTTKNIVINSNEVKIIEPFYENARVNNLSKEDSNKKTLYSWENFHLQIRNGELLDLPVKEPDLFPIIKYSGLNDLNNEHLINALGRKSKATLISTIALLDLKQLDSDILLAKMLTDSLQLNTKTALLLAKFGDSNAVDYLVDILKDDENKHRNLAAWTLGEIGDVKAVDYLIAALEDKSEFISNYAAFALAKIKDNRAVDALIEATKNYHCWDGNLLVDSEIELFIAHFFSYEKGLGCPAVPAPFNCVRETAIYALGQIGDEFAIPTLISFLNNSNKSIQTTAMMALRNFNNDEVIEALILKLHELELKKDDRLWIVVTILGKNGNTKAVSALKDLANKELDTDIKEAIESAIESLKKKLH